MPGTDVDEDTVAHHYVTDVYDPVIEAIPAELADKLEPAEVFHEVLEHRWYLSQDQEQGDLDGRRDPLVHRQRPAAPARREGVPRLEPDGNWFARRRR